MGDIVPHLRARDAYAAPELVRGETGDPRADVYSVGALLFEMLSGVGFRREPGAAAVGAIARERSRHGQAPPLSREMCDLLFSTI